jgi:regulatory protein
LEARRYLDRHAASEGRLREVLLRRVQKAPLDERPRLRVEVDLVVAELKESGAVNDLVLAPLVSEGLGRRGVSARGIRHKLRSRGFGAESVGRALEGQGVEAELEAAWAYARRRRLGSFHPEPGGRRERRPKEIAAMARAGFSYDLARQVVDGEPEP